MVAPDGKDEFLSKAHEILIVGAGIGGLSAAIHLAANGQRVKILEKNATVGGKMNEIAADGFRWDTGPSVITMRHVFEDLFAAAGRRLEDYLNLVPVDPLTRYFYLDGRILDIHPQLENTLQAIQQFAPEDMEGYEKFLAYAAQIHRITGPVFIYNQPPTWRSFLKVSPFDALKIDGLRTMQNAIDGFVKSPQLRQLLGRFATYTGASPYRAPATLNVIADVELAGGVWYPRGGIYAIAKALRALAEELGVTICENTPVHHIEVQDGKVNGVLLAKGDFLPAEAVISNVDVGTVYEKMLPSVPPKRARDLLKMESSCSGFIMLLGIKGTHPQLAHHNIFFSRDYPREFDEIFRLGVPPSEPTVYVAITCKTDPQDAPSDHENWFVLVNAPPLGKAYDWRQQNYREVVLGQLAKFSVQPNIVTEKIITPPDLEQMSGARRGALYGTSSNNRWAAFLRPPNRAAGIQGLYFAGGTTHPGGGVPMVTLSGKVAATMCLEDLP